ncbi:transcriptional regulator [Prauserella marina]|uniref:Helix-turn-helix domain-containing protein n=1 Tax=Prauserella marina TaxID=530584 RepID=A0A222VXH2_9PSEU|nr:helix-turn-helix transcriptional regulator [Prauserella marina]ASR38614.1 transcriptional regulator [Prauserella marina]PWV81939.1 helix-turn-helix protein [Prauserella marina]SDD15762.1 Helix-turn-helix domain-containing protein [Prauserella marina]
MAAVDRTAGDQVAGPTARRMILGAQLRRLREHASITRADAGYHIRASESKISRLELGRVGFKDRDVADLLTLYGIGDTAEREQFLGMVKESNNPGWWQKFNDYMPKWFDDYVGLEEAAARIQTYELQFIPGLLQTEDYARAIITHGLPETANETAEGRIALRMRRQKLLHRPGAPRLWAVIDESVLYRPLGGAAVHRAQLDQLLELTLLPHISVQVVPYARSGYAAEGAFTLLRFSEPELPNIAYIEHIAGGLYLDRPDEIERIGRSLDRLAVDAETPDRSRQMITKLRAEF